MHYTYSMQHNVSIVCVTYILIMKANYFHVLDADVWKELPAKNVGTNGYVYAGRKFHENYEVKLFIREKEKISE